MGRFRVEDIVFFFVAVAAGLLLLVLTVVFVCEAVSEAREKRAHRVEQTGGNEHPTITLESGAIVTLGAPALEEAPPEAEDVIRHVGNGMILLNGHLFTTSSWDSRAKDHVRDACPACLEESP